MENNKHLQKKTLLEDIELTEEIIEATRKMFINGLNRDTPNWETDREQLHLLKLPSIGDNEFVKAHKERLAREKLEKHNMEVAAKLFKEDK